MSTTITARVFLALNAAFSAIVGLELIVFPDAVAQAMFMDPAGWKPLVLRLLGIGLVLFALDLLLMATNRFVAKKEVLLIVFADVGWLIASAAAVLLGAHVFTERGIFIIDVVAFFVAAFAAGQYFGARKIVPPESRVSVRSTGGTLIATVRRAVDAPPETVWGVMTDHPGYADVASNISRVEVLSGEGIGMQRRCYGRKGESWAETCDLFEDGRSFGFKVHTEAPDYPYPISGLEGRWSVEPKGAGAEFSIDIEAKPKGGFVSRTLFSSMAKRQFKAVLIDLADAWSRKMEREAQA
ncbi:MAG: SRPBCC family protein [Pseudomonadota bacterium]